MSADMATLTVVLVAVMVCLTDAEEIYDATTELDNVTSSLACPPGFMLQGNNCVCADWPNGMIICNDDSQVASIQYGYCMTYDNDTGEVVAGMCPRWSLPANWYHSRLYYQLPKSLSELNDICDQSHHTGTLCGKCNVQDGYGPTMLTYTSNMQCVKCIRNTNNWVRFFTSTFLPITLILAVIIGFGITIVSGSFNAFILFAYFSRYIPVIKLLLDDSTYINRTKLLNKVVVDIYGLSSLRFFPSFFSGFCVIKNLNELQAVALEYIIAVYPLFLVIVLYVCIQLHARNFRPIVCCWRPFHKYFVYFRRSVDPKASMIHAFATLILLSYTKFLTVTFFLISPTMLYNGKGEKHNPRAMLYFANIHFFHKQHLPYALLAISVLLSFIAIPPLLLCLYPCAAFQKCLTKCKLNSQVLRAFVEIFQGCFKDGTNGTCDYRYFSGLYFILRIIPLLIYTSGETIGSYASGSTILYLATAAVLVVLQPYKKRFHNVVDATIFIIMAALFQLIVSQMNYFLITGHTSVRTLVMIDILFMLPLMYVVLHILYWIVTRNSIQRILQCRRCIHRQAEAQVEGGYGSIPDRMVNPVNYELLNP